ncbi:MAG: NTP transferase domain-containing protein, partial [Spirochaetaceae bacterium]|nr:NTP transferase domain-containing protein [Spirochaetaceae bacterium]
VGDNPLADEKLIAKMQTVFYRTNTIVAPEFNESLGNPIIFPFRYRTELMRLSGDTGGKKIIYTHMGDVTKIQAPPTVLFDIDTVDDIYKL